MSVTLSSYNQIGTVFTTWWCCTLSFDTQHQGLTFWELTDEYDLSNVAVYETSQDDQGFIWIGVENRIRRCDVNLLKLLITVYIRSGVMLKIRKDA